MHEIRSAFITDGQEQLARARFVSALWSFLRARFSNGLIAVGNRLRVWQGNPIFILVAYETAGAAAELREYANERAEAGQFDIAAAAIQGAEEVDAIKPNEHACEQWLLSESQVARLFEFQRKRLSASREGARTACFMTWKNTSDSKVN